MYTNLSIIIINFNTENIILDCLNSLYNSDLEDIKIELILIDNASIDESVKNIKNFLLKNRSNSIKPVLIQNKKNIGFAKANNNGIKLAQANLILLLNSDVILEKNTIYTQVKTLEESKKTSVVTCKLILPNNQIDPACHRGFPTPWASFSYLAKLERLFPKSKLFSQYHQGWKNLEKPHQIDVISGAFFLTKKEIFEKVGLFDEDYFMYGEDIDLCFRLNKKGYKILFNPISQALHLKGQSGRAKRNAKLDAKRENNKHESNKYFWETMKLFYQKHYSNIYPKFLQTLIFKFINYKMK